LWAGFDFGDGHVISTGPSEPIKTSEYIVWDYYSRQGVHLLYNNMKTKGMANVDNKNCEISVKVKFIPQKGDVSFKFTPNWKC